MKIQKSDFRGIYAEMVEILGEETVRLIHKYYKGQQINLPMKLYSNEYIERYLIENIEKKSIREMARELGYSDKWISKLIKNIKLDKESLVKEK
ncbi:Mor transcription activator family protein [Intestinibacter sp.]